MRCRGYKRVTSLEEALSAANNYGDKALFVAGATDVAVKARESEPYADRVVIDIADLTELSYIRESDDKLHIGALCSHASIAANPLIQCHCGMLARACSEVGSPQIRNRGTIGGNIANTSPAADTLPALAALHAAVTLQTLHGQRTAGLSELICGAYRTHIAPGELITEITVDKLSPKTKQYFYKVARRNALAISRLTIAAAALLDADGTVLDVRVALGSVFPRPMVFPELSNSIIGKQANQNEVQLFAKALSDKIPEIAGRRSSTAYKQPVSDALVRRALEYVLEVDSHG